MLHDESEPRLALLEVIRQVRQRWRLKLAVRGAVGFLGATILALIASAYALETLKFTPAAIITFRIVLPLVTAAGVGWFLVRPLLRKVSDEQVALYLEEHEPTLEATIVTALDAQRAGRSHEMSPALVRKLVEVAIERMHEVGDGRRIEQIPVRRYATTTGIVALVALALFALGPAYLRHALSALLVISRDVEAAAPYRIDVTPGNLTVPKGADQTITAKLHGFTASEAQMFMRKAPDAAYEALPMVRAENGDYDGLLFDLSQSLDYYVEAAGVRSPTFALKVVELPYVKQLDLELHFPAYTALEPRTIEDGGDVAALAGTDVRLKVQPTMATGSGRIVMNDGSTLPLTANADGTLAGSFKTTANGFYKIELDGPAGEKVPASPQYAIDILEDMAPTVTLSKPGRDSDATPVQEFVVEARADDDFAVRNLQLVYSVNGGAEKTIPLFGGSRPSPEVTAGHTFYLEELGVQPGDAVSYYARATDNDAASGPKVATSDIYFLRIRPFGKDFKPAQSMGGGGGGGGGAGGDVGALSQQQRQIIAGTFKVQRDRKQMGAAKAKEALVVLALSQSRLREQVQGLVDRMNSRLVTPDPAFKKIAELLPMAAAEMKTAEAKLQAQSAEQALPPENKALQFLQQAEEEYELQVQTQRNAGGGGGGGGAGSIAEDLAELFKLEMDKMANQYETSQRAMQQNADQQIDELAEKLRELARRQEQELQRQRQLANQNGRDARGGELQRQLAQQAEEAARQLEKLSREQNRPDLAQAARQMQQAADAMRRAAANGDPSAAGQAAAAAERLRQVQRQLQGQQGQRAERDIKDAQRQAEELARENREITSELRTVPSQGGDRQQRLQQLSERKAELSKKVGALEGQLDKTAAELVKEAREASRKVQEAAGQIRDDKIKEKLNYSRQVMGSDNPQLQEFQRTLEEQLEANFDALRRKLDDAAASLGPNGRDRNADALDRTRDLARGVDSFGRRLQERGEQRANEAGRRPGEQGSQGRDQQGQQQNQQGQQGREGQQGQQGQSGQQGQDGQRGQQGQGGQQGQDGQRGQQGQGGQQGGGNNQDGRDGVGDTSGAWRDGAGGWGSRRPWGEFNAEDVRQFRDEARRFAAEGRQLRDYFRQQNLDARELEEILRRLRELEDSRIYKDVDELLALQSFVGEGMKRVEYTLRRQLGEEANRAIVTGAEEVPQEFRKLVEEYYRTLSKGQAPTPKRQ
jgi:hypothetical protein